MRVKHILAVIGIFITGCGGVDIGSLSIPVEAGDISFGNGNTVTIGDSGEDAIGAEGSEVALDDDEGSFSAYDLYVEIVPHSGVLLYLTVTDPTGYSSYAGYGKLYLAWPTNSAFDGLHTVFVEASRNSNPAHEQVHFTLLIYQSGKLIIDEDFSVAEGDTFSLPVEIVFSAN